MREFFRTLVGFRIARTSDDPILASHGAGIVPLGNGSDVRRGADALAAADAAGPAPDLAAALRHLVVDPLTPTPADDGSLTALEVHRLSVPADLVTLSACESGRGRIYPGEGSAGLAQAFMVAGASRVLVSVWKVDDAATAALMTKFYESFKKGAPAARALRDAQDFVKSQEKWREPQYWAAWVLWGEGG